MTFQSKGGLKLILTKELSLWNMNAIKIIYCENFALPLKQPVNSNRFNNYYYASLNMGTNN